MGYQQDVADDRLSYVVIGCAIDVHRALGPHQPEAIYRDALSAALEDHGLQHEVEKEVPIEYRGRPLGTAYLDLVVEDSLVLELKAVRRMTEEHFHQLRRNVEALNATRGLLINFGEPSLRIRRFANNWNGR